jgi:hypothetical protein
MNYGASSVAAHSPRAPVTSTSRNSATPSNYRVAATKQNQRLRPEVQYAMRALHEMPPFARQREIETGRYSHFSAEERQILRSVE